MYLLVLSHNKHYKGNELMTNELLLLSTVFNIELLTNQPR